MTPGLWMAPFACDKHSRLAAEHPSWVLSRRKDVPANSANCGKWFYGLDVTNPEVRMPSFDPYGEPFPHRAYNARAASLPQVRRHIHDCIHTATATWGFRYLKLDFLYAAALRHSHDSYQDRSLTRAQAMQVQLAPAP